MYFEIIGKLEDVEPIASGPRVRERRRLRKMKGLANVKLSNGTICHAELHWYEAHGIGSRAFKVKRILEIQ